MKDPDLIIIPLVSLLSCFVGILAGIKWEERQQPKLEVVAVNHGQCKCGRESKMVIYEKGEN
jgi:hypothetical protein